MASTYTLHSPHSPPIRSGFSREYPQALDYDRAVIFSKNSHSYFGFTTISRYAFDVERSYWLTLEHYIQAKKFEGHPSRIEAIKNFPNPEEISGYVNDPENARLLDDKWNKKKCEYMFQGLHAKFTQNGELYNQLLNTENKFIIYETENDWTWGTGYNRKGKNYLGRLLCYLRTYLLRNPSSRTPPTYKYSDLPDNRVAHTLSTPYNAVTSTLTSYDDVIHFGDKDKRYFELCNDSKHGIVLNEVLWMTVTHYYLAQKFQGNVHLQNTIAAFESPTQARQYASNKNAFQVPDFQSKRDSIMQHALQEKFARHPAIAEVLSSTHPKKLIYECAEDSYWGIGHDSKGVNRLGIMLTDMRKNYLQSPLPSLHYDDIYFKSSSSDYSEFTTYSQHSIRLDGEQWSTVSHYFQAKKFVYRPDIVKLIRASDSPLAAWEIAHNTDNAKLVPMNFLNERDDVMERAMRAKVEQNEDVCRLLKATGEKRLIFSGEDLHWGIGHDRTGENMLGKILMNIRRTLLSIPSTPRITSETYKPYSKPPPPVSTRVVSTATGPILFFNEKDSLYPLATFSVYQFKVSDCVYRSLNHYFQAQKFTTSPDIYRSIVNAPTPLEALKISQEHAEKAIDDFNDDRFKIMETGLRARFDQNPSLKDLLLETGNRELIFDNKHDSYWGVGNGSGKNRFGILLMKIREQFSKAYEHASTSPLLTSRSLDTEPIDYPPAPPLRMPHTSKHLILDRECAEPPVSFIADIDNDVILAKDAKGETIITFCDPNIRYPSSLCYDEEYLYVVTAPTLVKINKSTGKKISQIPLENSVAQVNYTRDRVLVVHYQKSSMEDVYSTDLVKY